MEAGAFSVLSQSRYGLGNPTDICQIFILFHEVRNSTAITRLLESASLSHLLFWKWLYSRQVTH